MKVPLYTVLNTFQKLQFCTMSGKIGKQHYEHKMSRTLNDRISPAPAIVKYPTNVCDYF